MNKACHKSPFASCHPLTKAHWSCAWSWLLIDVRSLVCVQRRRPALSSCAMAASAAYYLGFDFSTQQVICNIYNENLQREKHTHIYIRSPSSSGCPVFVFCKHRRNYLGKLTKCIKFRMHVDAFRSFEGPCTKASRVGPEVIYLQILSC